MDLIYLEIAEITSVLLIIFGFYDRIFFIFSTMLNWITGLSAMIDGSIITKVDLNGSGNFVQYTTSTLQTNGLPSEPILPLLFIAVMAILLFFVRTYR